MLKKLGTHYITPILLSLTVAIILISLEVIKKSWGISLVMMGALLGTFLLDLEYIFFIYIIEPNHPFSKTVKKYFNDKDFSNGLRYIYHHKPEIKSKTLQSAVFQACLGALTIYVATSTYSLFVKALLISALANSIYKMADYYFRGDIEEWFWMLKEKPTKNNLVIYTLALMVALIFSLIAS